MLSNSKLRYSLLEQEENIQFLDVKRIFLLNIFILISLVLSVFYVAVYVYFNISFGIFSNVFFTLAYTSLYILSIRGKHRFARLAFLYLINIHIYIFLLFLGTKSMVHLFYFPIVIAPLLLYSVAHFRKTIAFIALSTLFFVSVFFYDSKGFSTEISPDLTAMISTLTLSSVFLTEAIMLITFVYSHHLNEKKILNDETFSRTQFEFIFDNSFDAWFLLNEKREIFKANQRAVQLFEMQNENDFHGLTAFDLYQEIPNEDEIVRIRETLAKGELYHHEVLYKTFKGNSFWGDVSVKHLMIGDEKFYSARLSDITERKNLENQLRQNLHEKSVLMAEIHHRVRNNLAIIKGLLSVYNESEVNEYAQQLLQDSTGRIQSMIVIHEKLYASDDFSQVNLMSFIDEIVNNTDELFANKKVKIVNNSPEESTAISVNVNQAIPLSIIVNEIITNSYKHAFLGDEEGEIQIFINSLNDNVLIEISDNGTIKEKVEKQIQTMGETLIKELVKQLNGFLSVEKNNGYRYQIEFKIENFDYIESEKLFNSK
ncbi:MAG: histidine kinase dimerization/phosphoacceptor domain -containing protein [Fluviicola sp.]